MITVMTQNPSAPDDDVITAEEAAAMLRCTVVTIQRWARRGEIPGRKIGKRWLFSRAQLADHIRRAQ